MGVDTDELSRRDVYVFYDFEDVYFRYDRASRTYYRKFAGEAEKPCDPLSGLLADAMNFGEEVTKEEYERG